MKHTMLLCLVLALAPAAAPAELYKWVDGDGKTHYSDKPPAEAQTRPETVEGGEVNVVEPVAVPAPSPPPRVAPAPAQSGTVPARVVEEQISDCERQWRIYDESEACFNACAERVFSLAQGRAVRNTERCGHCTDVRKPRCER